MDAGQLVPDEITVRLLLDRLGRADADGGVILDGFPRTDVQARALDDALASRDSAVRVAVLVDVPAEELVRRMSGRWVCRAAGHPYHELFSPPHVAGICDLDGSELYQRSDDRPETIRARMTQQLGALGAVVDHYRGLGRPAHRRRAAGDRRGRRRDRRRRRPPRGLAARAPLGETPTRLMHVTRKSKAEIAKMRSAGRIVAEVLALVEESLHPGVLDRRARPPRRAPHPRGEGHAVVPQLPRRPALRRARPARLSGLDLHLDRQRDRPRHPRRPRDQGGAAGVGRRRRDLRRLARRRGADLRVRRRRRGHVRRPAASSRRRGSR